MAARTPRRRRLALGAAIAAGALSCGPGLRGTHDDPGDAARTHLARGDTTRAIAQLERCHLEERRDPELFKMLGSLYRSRGTIDARLRSQRHLERALQLFPDDPGVLMELGRTYYTQTFYPDAERCFRAALALDTSMCDPHYYLGVSYYEKWKRVNDYVDDLGTACHELARALACDSSNVDAAIRYAFGLYALGHADSSRTACAEVTARFPHRPEFHLLRGVLAYDDERWDDAANAFEAGLALAEDEARAAYEDIVPFLASPERTAYAASAPPERAAYDRSYWLDIDPDPTTPRNERRLEHIYRTFLADLFYSCAHPPRRGWETERGQTLIKFGRPDSVESSLGGSWKDGRYEKWTYDDDGGLLQFLFVDELLNGNLRIPYRADSMVGVLRYAPFVSAYDPPFVDVPGTMDVVTFKDTDMSGVVCVAMRVDADSVLQSVDLAGVDHFYVRGSIFDDRWQPETRFADTLWTSELAETRRGESRAYEVVRVVDVPFDNYHVACTFQDEHGLVAARLRADGDASRYAGDRLALSDILLQARGPSPAVLERRGRVLRPNAGRVYEAGERLVIYFEIYNLGVRQRHSDYSVTFLIYESPEAPPPAWRRWGARLAELGGVDRDPTISQTFQRSGDAHTDQEEVAIDIDTLAGGRYELVVSISDGISGATAETSTRFFKSAGD